MMLHSLSMRKTENNHVKQLLFFKACAETTVIHK